MSGRVHSIVFPRYDEDIETERRTVFHVPHDGRSLARGDRLNLIAHPTSTFRKIGFVTQVDVVDLLEYLDVEIEQGYLGDVDRDGYLARWDRNYHRYPAALNPQVIRVAFRYQCASDLPDPPEWGIAA